MSKDPRQIGRAIPDILGEAGAHISGKRPNPTTLVHTESTTAQRQLSTSYRDFLASGMNADMEFARDVLQIADDNLGGSRVSRFNQCKSQAYFSVHKTTREVKIHASSCNLRWCPLCIKSRRAVIMQSVGDWLTHQQKPRFLTLTLKHHSSPIADQIDALYYFFRQLRKTKLWKSKVTGGIWFFHIKKSKDDRVWHPHLHVAITGRFIIQKELSQLWRTITHGSPVVDIRGIKHLDKAAREVARYASCPCRLSTFSKADAFEIVAALNGRRICGTFGTAKGVPLRPVSDGDSSEWISIESWYSVTIGVGCDDLCTALWRCWTLKQPYCGELPMPPPDIGVQINRELDKPRSFEQGFFDFNCQSL